MTVLAVALPLGFITGVVVISAGGWFFRDQLRARAIRKRGTGE